MMTNEPIITVLGPTATGKTGVAVRIAAELGGEIVSADSRQVFRRMDIGSGKDLSEYQYNGNPIPYHLIDVEEPGREYNVYRYQQEAFKAIRDIQERGKRVVFCGGSGLYIDAVLQGSDFSGRRTVRYCRIPCRRPSSACAATATVSVSASHDGCRRG